MMTGFIIKDDKVVSNIEGLFDVYAILDTHATARAQRKDMYTKHTHTQTHTHTHTFISQLVCYTLLRLCNRTSYTLL